MPSTQEQLALFSSWIYLKVKTPPTWKPFILGSANSWFVLCGLYIYMSLKPLFPDGRGKLAGEGIGEESKGGFIFSGVYHAETFAVSFLCCSPWCWSSSLPQPHWSTEEEAGQIADMEAKLPPKVSIFSISWRTGIYAVYLDIDRKESHPACGTPSISFPKPIPQIRSGKKPALESFLLSWSELARTREKWALARVSCRAARSLQNCVSVSELELFA